MQPCRKREWVELQSIGIAQRPSLHRLLFYAYPIGILPSLLYVSQKIRSIETTGGAWPHRYAGVRRRKATRSGRIRYSTRCRKGGVFSVGGGGVIGRVRAGSGSTCLANRGAVAGLTDKLCGRYPRVRLCQSAIALESSGSGLASKDTLRFNSSLPAPRPCAIEQKGQK